MYQHIARQCRGIGKRVVRMFATATPSPPKPQSASAKRSYALLLLPATAFGLGTWQVFRKGEKEKLIASIDARTRGDPIPLPSSPSDCDKMEYQRVKVTGEFLHDKEFLVSPRTKTREMFTGMADIPEPGCHVVTPFRRSDDGTIILVNRGFVPNDRASTGKRREGQVEGTQTLEGIVRRSERKNAFTPENKPEASEWHWMDIDTMAKAAGTEPILIDAATNATPPGGYPLAGQTQINIRNEHMQYIVTWYSLSVATLAMWYFFSGRRGSSPNVRRMPPPIARHNNGPAA